MKTIMMFVCLLVAVASGIALLFEEPGLVMLCAVGWVGFIFFRHRIRFEQDEKGHPTSHRPRHKHPQAKVPSKYD